MPSKDVTNINTRKHTINDNESAVRFHSVGVIIFVFLFHGIQYQRPCRVAVHRVTVAPEPTEVAAADTEVQARRMAALQRLRPTAGRRRRSAAAPAATEQRPPRLKTPAPAEAWPPEPPAPSRGLQDRRRPAAAAPAPPPSTPPRRRSSALYAKSGSRTPTLSSARPCCPTSSASPARGIASSDKVPDPRQVLHLHNRLVHSFSFVFQLEILMVEVWFQSNLFEIFHPLIWPINGFYVGPSNWGSTSISTRRFFSSFITMLHNPLTFHELTEKTVDCVDAIVLRVVEDNAS